VSNDTHSATISFDRMRSMLVRAAEIRDSEQQQVFDALDEIHARLSPLESIGSVRKRLSELPDRTEVSVLAERMDETLAKVEAQDGAIAGLTRTVEAIVDRLAKPFAELGGRLDGMAGRFEGVAGRMDGLEDRIAGLHKRIDDLDHHLDKQDSRLDGLPSAVHGPVRERLDTLEVGLRTRADDVDTHIDRVQRFAGEVSESIGASVTQTRDQLAGRLDELTETLDTLEGQLAARVTELAGAMDKRLVELDGAVENRPDSDSVVALVRTANEESERRHAAQLDEAMATFAELILGGGAAQLGVAPPQPRSAQRRGRKPAVKSREPENDDAEDGAVAAS